MNTLNRLRAMTPDQLERWRRARLGAFTLPEREALDQIYREQKQEGTAA